MAALRRRTWTSFRLLAMDALQWRAWNSLRLPAMAARRLPAIMPIPWLPRGLPSMGINGLYHGAAHRVG